MKTRTQVGVHHIVLLASTFALAGCGSADQEGSEEFATVSEELVGWTPWVSEEQPAGTQCGDVQRGATRAGCSGSYCDSMRLFCGVLPQGIVNIPGTAGDYWAPYVSEEGGGPAMRCTAPDPYHQMGIIDGIRATGSYSDNVSVHCAIATLPTQNINCDWTPFFSEEQGEQVFHLNPFSRTGPIANGVRCSNSYCDNLSFNVCEPKCRSNADCFGVCDQFGVCRPG